MELRQIEHVVAVVDHGGFTRAAAALHLAQPSLSQSVARLEKELGVRLFDRAGRTVRLTEVGSAFIGPARRLLRQQSDLEATVASFTGLVTGTLDLVALSTLVADPLAPLLGEYRAAHPGVMVRITGPESTADLLDAVRDGRAEIGVTDLSEGTPDDLASVRIARQQILVVCPPGTQVPPSGAFSVRDLARADLLAGPPGTSTRALIEQAFRRAAVQPGIVLETSQREALVPLVLAGAGVTFLPEPSARDAAHRGAVVAPLSRPLHRTTGAVYRARALSPAGRAFVAALRDRGVVGRR